jgi:hypothetical protein
LLCHFANRLEQTIHRGSTHAEQLLPHFNVQLQMPVPFHGLDECWNRFLQPFSTDPIGGFPNHRQRRYGRVVIQPCPRCFYPHLQLY